MTFKKKDKPQKVSVDTESKQRAKSLANLQPFEKGQSGNPAGRPKGSRSKFAEAFLKDFINDWEEGGVAAIAKVRKDDPSTYLRVAASLLPKELNIKDEDNILDRLLEQFSTEQLDQFIIGITAIGVAEKSQPLKDSSAIRGESTRVF